MVSVVSLINDVTHAFLYIYIYMYVYIYHQPSIIIFLYGQISPAIFLPRIITKLEIKKLSGKLKSVKAIRKKLENYAKFSGK